MRKRAEREEARRLFVEGQYSLDEIAERTGVPRRTLSDWSAKVGWADQQTEYLERNSTDIASLEDVIRGMEKAIAADQKKKYTISPGRLFALSKMRDDLRRMKGDAKREGKKSEEAKPAPPLSVENFLKLEKEIHGLSIRPAAKGEAGHSKKSKPIKKAKR